MSEMIVTDIVLQWENTRGLQIGIDICNEIDGYRLTVGGYSGMQVGMDIGNMNDEYRLTVGNTRRMPVYIDFGFESDGNQLTVERYSGDAGRYCYCK